MLQTNYSAWVHGGALGSTSGGGGGDGGMTARRERADNLSSCSAAMQGRPAGNGWSVVLKPSDTQRGGAEPSATRRREEQHWAAGSRKTPGLKNVRTSFLRRLLVSPVSFPVPSHPLPVTGAPVGWRCEAPGIVKLGGVG